MKISLRTLGQATLAGCLLTALWLPDGYTQGLVSGHHSPTRSNVDGVLTGPDGRRMDGSLMPTDYGGTNPLASQTGHFERVRIFANAQYGVQGNRHYLHDRKYAQYAHQFRGTGLVTWQAPEHSRIDHFNQYATFFFAGNCHTIITAAHVLFKKNGKTRGTNYYFYPNGDVEKKPIKVNFRIAKKEGRLHYLNEAHLGTDRGESHDVIGIRLRRNVADCGAYRVLPLSNAMQREFMKNDNLISVGFDGGAQNLRGFPQKLFDPHCRALTGNRVNMPWLIHVGFQPHNLLFNDCDDLPGRSGSPILIENKKQLFAVGVMVAQVSIKSKNQPRYKTTQGIPVPTFYQHFHGNVVPSGMYYKFQFPNIAVRFRSSYFEQHPQRNIQSMNIKQYACLRAQEYKRAPAFWLVEDTMRNYHQIRTMKATLESCHQ